MAFCSRCGKQLDSSASFCSACGAKTSFAQPAQSQHQAQAQTSDQHYTRPGFQPSYNTRVQPATPAIAMLKKVASSPIFLIGVIALSMNALLQLLTAATAVSPIHSFFGALYEFAYSVDFYEMIDFLDDIYYMFAYSRFNALAVVTTLIGMIPLIITIVGLWLIFATGVSRSNGGFSTTGVTMVKVINIINLVFACISFGFVAIFVLIAFIALTMAGSEYIPVAIGVFIVFLIFIAAAVLSIIYYNKITKSLNAIKFIATTGKPTSYASTFVGVFCFIGAGFTFISSLISLGTIFSYGSYYVASNFISLLTTLCSVTATACFGATIFYFRSKMTPRPVVRPVGYAQTVQPVQSTQQFQRPTQYSAPLEATKLPEHPAASEENDLNN